VLRGERLSGVHELTCRRTTSVDEVSAKLDVHLEPATRAGRSG
jgi:hypothetical protein